MSELEIQRRQEYKEIRKKWTYIQLIAIAVLIAVSLCSFLVYNRMNKVNYIEYAENSDIDYKVQYIKNDFFDGEWIEKDQSYISSLVNGIDADFAYVLNMGSEDVDFDYKYRVNAKLVIANKDTNAPFYTYEEVLVKQKSGSKTDGASLKIREKVHIDYVRYNEIANEFVKTYNLKNATSMLVVTLDVEVLGSGKQLEQSAQNKYSTSLNIPLTEDTFEVFSTSSAPSNETKVLAYKGTANKNVFLVLGIITVSLAALAAVALLIFLHLTKNEDITYAAKIRKILRTYGSYIQRMEGEFDSEGYQIIIIKTFTEMLGIRDTIQSPVLMSENKDETMTRFFIPTNTKILYTYAIRVDNYDEIYGEPVEEEPEEEVVLLDESVPEEEVAEAMAEPDVVLEEVNYVEDDDEELEEGIEVIGVVWPDKAKNNKVYRYDPNGEQLEKGDMVLVPTRDVHKNREVIRKAAVAHENHKIDPALHPYAIKKIIGVIKRHAETALTTTPAEETKRKK